MEFLDSAAFIALGSWVVRNIAAIIEALIFGD